MFRELDRILRGQATSTTSLKRATIDVRVGSLTMVLIGLAMLYGACMGFYSLFRPDGASIWQLAASMVKVPLLFILTLAVTLPSLYVSNALVGSRLSMDSVVRLLTAAMAVTIAVLASLGPIVAFFSASTTSYAFMLLLNVLVFAVSGAFGLAFLLQTMHRLSRLPPKEVPETIEVGFEEVPEGPAARGVLESEDAARPSRHVLLVFRLWILLFGLVGAQMAWVLRPFLGAPGQPFSVFRPRSSNFFEAVWHAFASLFS